MDLLPAVKCCPPSMSAIFTSMRAAGTTPQRPLDGLWCPSWWWGDGIRPSPEISAPCLYFTPAESILFQLHMLSRVLEIVEGNSRWGGLHLSSFGGVVIRAGVNCHPCWGEAFQQCGCLEVTCAPMYASRSLNKLIPQLKWCSSGKPTKEERELRNTDSILHGKLAPGSPHLALYSSPALQSMAMWLLYCH